MNAPQLPPADALLHEALLHGTPVSQRRAIAKTITLL